MSIMAMQFRLAAVLLLLSAASTAAATQALLGCSDKCGDLTVPYPFGMEKSCYRNDEFFIKCNRTTQPPTAYLRDENIVVTNISLEDGELRIKVPLARACYDAQGNTTSHRFSWLNLPRRLSYTVSESKNKFYGVGCDTSATLRGFRGELEVTTGCTSICNSLGRVVDNFCSGVGCCQINIPSGLNNVTVRVTSFNNHKDVWNFNPCSYGFIEEQGQFNFNGNSTFKQLNNTWRIPAVINWAIGNETDPCDKAQNRTDFACKGNSTCYNRPINGSVGYLCQCKPGYEGNPYHPDGCTDIDDCKGSNPCGPNGECKNLLFPQNYTCLCHKGYKNDSTNDKSCIKDESSKIVGLLTVSLGVCIGILVLLVLIWWVYWRMNKRRIVRLKEKYFKENGGLTLQQQLASHGGSVETAKIFTAEELKKATNNYHVDGILGEGGYGTVYKGILNDLNVVAIKKPKVGAPTQSDQFVNEVIVLSQINHRNVVKLLGCCFETEVPLLVYEYISHGTLFDHVFNNGKGSSLSWELRLKIASETAGALAYLHSSTSTPIIHRDVKTTNILLDDNYTAKVSDFGASRFIPLDQTQLATLVQGTLGYLDPEYFHSNQLTEKSDVYSFGVVLAELLTSKVALSFARPEKERCLASFFVSSIENDRLIQILDAHIVNEGNKETIEQVAKLAKRCLMIKSDERPTMREVAMELEGMRVMAKHTWKNGDSGLEGTEYLLGSPDSAAYAVNIGGGGDGGSSAMNSGTLKTGYDSMHIQMLMPYDDGR